MQGLVLVREDQLSLAIGRRGQNVRLASKLVGWDINVMTQESLDEQLDISIEAFSVVPKMAPELVENLVSQGFFTFDDLSVIEPDELMEMSGMSQDDIDEVIAFADVESERIEREEIARKMNPPAPKPRSAPEPEPVVSAEEIPSKVEESESGVSSVDAAPVEPIEDAIVVKDEKTESQD